MKNLLVLGLLVLGLSGCGIDSVDHGDLDCLANGGTAEECEVDVGTNKQDIEEIKEELEEAELEGSQDGTVPLKYSDIVQMSEATIDETHLNEVSINNSGTTVTFSREWHFTNNPNSSGWDVRVRLLVTNNGLAKTRVDFKEGHLTSWRNFSTWGNPAGAFEKNILLTVGADIENMTSWTNWSSTSETGILLNDEIFVELL